MNHDEVKEKLESFLSQKGTLEKSKTSLYGKPDIVLTTGKPWPSGRYAFEVKGDDFSSMKIHRGVGQAVLYGLYRTEQSFLAVPKGWDTTGSIVSNLVVYAKSGRLPVGMILVSNDGIEIFGGKGLEEDSEK